jgi:hypothetical protein
MIEDPEGGGIRWPACKISKEHRLKLTKDAIKKDKMELMKIKNAVNERGQKIFWPNKFYADNIKGENRKRWHYPYQGQDFIGYYFKLDPTKKDIDPKDWNDCNCYDFEFVYNLFLDRAQQKNANKK